MLGVTGGCEPEFALSYTRRTENLDSEYKVSCNAVKEYWKCTDETVSEDIDSLPYYFVSSRDIDWRNRIDIQAIMQNHVDTAISSTLNLAKDIPIQEVANIYLYGWSKGLKGVTIYRTGCEREGILTTEPKTETTTTNNKKDNKLDRGIVISTDDDLIGMKKKLITGCGSLHMGNYFDEFSGEPMETFINTGSSGSCERNLQFISRLMSLVLRLGGTIEAIVDQALSIKPCTAYTKKEGTSKGSSCPSAIGYAMQELYEKIQDRCFADFDREQDGQDYIDTIENVCDMCDEKDKSCTITANNSAVCPDCGEHISHEGGCNICHVCGWSKCE